MSVSVETRPSNRIPATAEAHKPEIKRIELAPDLIINPYLKEAGFDVAMEMGRLFRDINSGFEVETAAGELEVNIRAYDLEIIKQRPVLPHLNRFGEKDGKLRLVGNNGEPVVNAITAQERNGSVLRASKTIEDFLLVAPNNSFAVLMNPAGWNGFTDQYGHEVEPHLNAEIMIFWKDQKGVLKGLTLVIDLEEEQARQIMVNLGATTDISGMNAKERLINIVKNPALLVFPRLDINPFEYVLDKILTVRGGKDIRLKQRDGTAEARTVDEIRKDIEKFEELLQLNREEEKLIADPKKFILEAEQSLRDKSVQQEIINRIEKTILLLTRKYLKGTEVHRVVIDTNNRDDFAPEIMFLKSRAGCPASMTTRTLGGSSLGSAVSISGGFAESDQYGSLEFTCPKCKQTNRRSNGQLITNCQHCNADVRC